MQKLIFKFAYLEPFNCCFQQSRENLFNITDVVQLIGQWVVYIDRNDLPVSFAFIDQRHGAQDLHLYDITALRYAVANFKHINGIIVTLAAGRWVQMFGVLPGLWKCAVVPDVAMMRETISNKTQLAFLDVLFYGVEWIG